MLEAIFENFAQGTNSSETGATILLPISLLFAYYHEGHHLRAIIDTINKYHKEGHIKKIIIIITDELQKYTFMMDGETPQNALLKAKQLGIDWGNSIGKGEKITNNAIIATLQAPYEIKYWQACLTASDKFSTILEAIDAIYNPRKKSKESAHPLKILIDTAIEGFLETYKAQKRKIDPSFTLESKQEQTAKIHIFHYIREELVVKIIWNWSGAADYMAYPCSANPNNKAIFNCMKEVTNLQTLKNIFSSSQDSPRAKTTTNLTLINIVFVNIKLQNLPQKTKTKISPPKDPGSLSLSNSQQPVEIVAKFENFLWDLLNDENLELKTKQVLLFRVESTINTVKAVLPDPSIVYTTSSIPKRLQFHNNNKAHSYSEIEPSSPSIDDEKAVTSENPSATLSL